MATREAQRRAERAYKERNKEAVRYRNYRSKARNFIDKLATLEDLEDLESRIKEAKEGRDKMHSYSDYLEKYVEDWTLLGRKGDHDYYFDDDNDVVAKVPSENNGALWSNDTEPKYFYGKQALQIAEVWDNEFDYEYADDFENALAYAESD